MTWLNPWAWLGLLALAVPVLVHLLSRRTARVQPFPTLRFVPASPAFARRRTRLSDLLLLALRCAIIVAAVAALAQPYLLTARRTAAARALTRVVLVDTSASMRRDAMEAALTGARGEAARLAREAAGSLLIETAAPRSALPGAVAWLETRSGRRELVVLSDFQLGTIDSIDLAGVPAHTGIRLRRFVGGRGSAEAVHVIRHGASETVARVDFTSGRTVAGWTRRAAAAQPDGLVVLHGPDDATAVAAALIAVRAVGAPAVDPARPIAVVLPGAAERDELIRAAGPLSAPWMGDVVAAIVRDPILGAAAAGAAPAVLPADTAWVTVARSASGEPVIAAAAAPVAGRDRLLLLPAGPAAGATMPALIAAAGRATSTMPQASELEPAALTDAELARWQRAATAASPGAAGAGGPADGRWLWVLVLGLLALETWLRRRPGAVA